MNERFLKVGIDIMTFQAKDYLVIVDYYSKYPELQCLSDKTASTIIEQCKSVFARHGIPVEIVSDNMPFQSNEFIAFAKAWCIKTTTSSPTYSQSNGQAERSVQTLKKILKKTHEENTDPYLALLEYRNTPVSGMKYSPAQMLMSRRLRTKIPVATSLLTPNIVDPSAELIKAQSGQKRYYDRCANPLKPLQKGDVVCYRKNKKWNKSCVVDVRPEPRSYTICGEKGFLRRNRRHLYKANLTFPTYNRHFQSHRANFKQNSDVNQPQLEPLSNSQSSGSVMHESRPTSRYGRPIKFPSK